MKWNRGAPTIITQPVPDVTMHWLLGPTISSYLWTCHWVSVFESWKQLKPIFTFHDCHLFFWVTESWKQWFKTHPTKCSSVGPTWFGWWKQKIEWYHSKSPTTKLFPNFKVDIIRRKWVNGPFKKTIRHFAQFSKLIREMPIFWNSIFLQSNYKKKKKKKYGAL